eukprot:UN13854
MEASCWTMRIFHSLFVIYNFEIMSVCTLFDLADLLTAIFIFAKLIVKNLELCEY